MSEQAVQLKRWITVIVVTFVATVVGCLYFFWVILHDLSELQYQVADLRKLVIVDQNARIQQAEIVINDLESSLMPGLTAATKELENIGKDMHEVKALLKNKN